MGAMGGKMLGRQVPGGLLRRRNSDGGASYYLARPGGDQRVLVTTAEQEANGIEERAADAVCALVAPPGRIGRDWRRWPCSVCRAPQGEACRPWAHAGP